MDVYDDLVELLPDLGIVEGRILAECDRQEAAAAAAEEVRLQAFHGNPRRITRRS